MEEGGGFHQLAAFEDAEGLLLGLAVLEDEVGFVLVYACAEDLGEAFVLADFLDI